MNQQIEIVNCECCKPLSQSRDKYHTDIIATSCRWIESVETRHSLSAVPGEGKSYLVFLIPPVSFHLGMELWLLYDSPSTTINGYEKEEEIGLARFCYGRISDIISHDKSGAIIEFVVLNFLTYRDILRSRPSVELPAGWEEQFYIFIQRDDYVLQTIGDYHLLSISFAQGDIGQSCIITKHDDSFYICQLHEWCMAASGTFGGKFILPDGIRNLLRL